MLELEIVVVLIGLRTETNLFDFNLNLFGLKLLLVLLLLIEELTIIYNTTYRWLGVRGYFNQVETLFAPQVAGLDGSQLPVTLYHHPRCVLPALGFAG